MKNKTEILKNLLQKIFSVKNSGIYKLITILGLEFQFKNYKKMLQLTQQELKMTKESLEYMKEHSDITKLKPATGKLREQQLKLVEFAKEFFNEIKELNIKPILLGGGLIGTIKHKGFIPWDDDLDFGLIRNDYEKLIDYCNKNFVCKYYDKAPGYTNEYDVSEYTNRFLKENPNQYILIHRWNMLKIIKGTSIADYKSLDIFSFDFINEKYDYKWYRNWLDELKKLIWDCDNSMQAINILNERKKLKDIFVEDSNQIFFGVDSGISYIKRDSFIPKELFYPLQKAEFENEEFYIPNNPVEYLKYDGVPDCMQYPNDVGIQKHNIYEEELIKKEKGEI